MKKYGIPAKNSRLFGVNLYIEVDSGYENMWFNFYADNKKKALLRAKRVMKALNSDYDNLEGVIVASQSELYEIKNSDNEINNKINLPEDFLE